ncbi:MAG: hypothetical protein EBS55_14570 [Flavobacteriaceae bacterium]|nr:hypothetical protein [Flavobacteriaceae bacterium]
MAPFYRQNLLMACEPYFNKTISGQGVDCFLMPVLQVLHQQTNTAIVHAVQIKHARPIRSHQRLYQNGLNNEQEIEIIRQASINLVQKPENNSKFNSSFKRLVLKDGNKHYLSEYGQSVFETKTQVRLHKQSYDFFIDGIRDFGSYYRDPFNLENIEVIQGPSSIAFGRGSAGGVIEQNSKEAFLGDKNKIPY